MLKLEVKLRGTNLLGFNVRRKRTAFWPQFAEFSFLSKLGYRKTDTTVLQTGNLAFQNSKTSKFILYLSLPIMIIL